MEYKLLFETEEDNSGSQFLQTILGDLQSYANGTNPEVEPELRIISESISLVSSTLDDVTGLSFKYLNKTCRFLSISRLM